MPKLPTAEALGQPQIPVMQQQRVIPLELATPNEGPEAAALAEFGKATSGVGNALNALALKEKINLDSSRAESATTQYLNGLHDFQMGPQNGFENIKGGDAITQPLQQMYRDRRDALRDQISSSLDNPEQQRAFAQRAAIADRSFDATLYRHIAQQSEVYQNQTFEGRKEAERQQAALNWQQPGAIDLALLNTDMMINQQAERAGLHNNIPADKATIDAQKQIAHTRIHSDVIDQMLMTGHDQAAKSYYDGIRNQLTPEAITILGMKVKASATEGEAMRGADAIWQQAGPTMPNQPVDLFKLDQMARTTYANDPHTADAVVNQLHQRFSVFNETNKQLNAANGAAVWDMYNNNKPLAAIQTSKEWLALDGTERTRLTQEMATMGWTKEERARSAKRYAEEDLSHAAFPAFERLMGDPQTLAGMSENQILAMQPQMGQQLTAQLLDQHRRLDTPAHIAAVNVDNDAFKSIVAASTNGQLNPYNPKLSASDLEKIGRLRNEAEIEIDNAQRQNGGKELSREQKNTVIQTIVDRQVMSHRFFLPDQSVPAATVKPDQFSNIYVPIENIDPGWIKGAINWMRSNGIVDPRAKDSDVINSAIGKRLMNAYAIRQAGGTAAQGEAALRGGAATTVPGNATPAPIVNPFSMGGGQ